MIEMRYEVSVDRREKGVKLAIKRIELSGGDFYTQHGWGLVLIELKQSESWTDPGYFSGHSKLRNGTRLLFQLISPPKGHRTLPTKTGFLLILISLGIGTAAFNTSHNILYIVLSLLLTSLILSGILSWSNFKGCKWRVRVGDHFRAGEVSPVKLELANAKDWLPTYALQFVMMAEKSGATEILRLKKRLEPKETIELEWLYQPLSRGKEEILLKGLISKFPFGFLKKSISESVKQSVIIWPGRVAYRINYSAGNEGQYAGSDQHRKGEGTDVFKIREYQHGDSVKHIHWKASARVQKLLIKETAEEIKQRYMVKMDLGHSRWKENSLFEKLCSVVGSVVEDLAQENLLASVCLGGDQEIMVTGLSDIRRIMNEISEIKPLESKAERSRGVRSKSVLTFRPGVGEQIKIYLDDDWIGEA